MIDPKQKRVSVVMDSAPVFRHEAQRRTAFVQAAVFQAGELKASGHKEGECADYPRMGSEPLDVFREFMQDPIAEMGGNTKAQPSSQVTQDDKGQELPAIRALRG